MIFFRDYIFIILIVFSGAAIGGDILRDVPIRWIKKIEFAGQNHFSERELLEKTELHVDKRFDRSKVVEAGEKLKALYGEAGFYDTIIEVEFIKQSDGQLIVHFQIDEKQPCRIANVVLQTENPQLRASLNKALREYNNVIFSETTRIEIQTRINEYLTDNHYLRSEAKTLEVEYNPKKTLVTLTFPISNPYRYDIIPVGIYHISLIEFYQTLDLDHFERTNLDPVTTLVEKVRTFYLSRGFAQVDAKTEIQEAPKQFLRTVRILIREGHRVRLNHIEVSGRISQPPSYYSSFVLDASSVVVQLGYFNRQDIETGLKNLVIELKNQGYLKAKVQSLRVEYSDTKEQASVYIVMDEGSQTEVRRVDFVGIKAFSPIELSDLIPVKSNAPLKLNNVEVSIELLKKFYLSRGYLEMKILNPNEDLIEYNERGSEASIRFRIYEGPKIWVKSIVVEGNDFTHTDVVLREISIHPGDVLSLEQIDESTVRLNKFGIFSRVEIRTLEENTSVSERTVIISVNERDPGVFRYGGGVNSSRNFTVAGFTGLSYNNLGGTGRALSARVELSYNISEVHYLENKIAAGYLEPFLLGTRTRGRVNVSRGQFVFFYSAKNPNQGSSPEPFTVIDADTKIDFLLERDLARHIKLTWTLLGADSQFTYERHGQSIDPADGIHDNGLRVNYIGPTLDFDFRDNPFLPTRGHYFRIDNSYADPAFGSSSDVKFIRSEATYSYYIPIKSPRWVWTNSVRGGYESNFFRNQGTGIPASYAFFLGGFNTIRGFDATTLNDRVPPDYDLHFVYPTQLIIPRDSSFYLFKSELRFPLVGDFGGVLFYDGGEVSVTQYRFEHPYRQSIGLGFRFNTPVGPASLDLAFKLNPIKNITVMRNSIPTVIEANEPAFRVHFYIGTF